MVFGELNVAIAHSLNAIDFIGPTGIDPVQRVAKSNSPVVIEESVGMDGETKSLERVIPGGMEQTILIRSQDTSQPVLLFLHSGPGGAIISWVNLVVQRKALDLFRDGDFYTVGLWDHYLAGVMEGKIPSYTMAQVERHLPGLALSRAGIGRPEIVGENDLFVSFPEADIPVHFITGSEDHNAPADLAEAYQSRFCRQL